MPAPRFRSRSMKRVQVRTPGGRMTLHYKRRRPNYARCVSCGAALQGVPRGSVSSMAKLAKTEKRPQRIFGGNLCSACTRERIKEEARKAL